LLATLAQALAAPVAARAASANTFVDVLFGHHYYDAVQGLYEAGVVDGYPVEGGKEFRPDNSLWRAQFTKMILGALDIQVTEDAWRDEAPPFSDLGADATDDLYPHDYIAEAARRGITYGTSATAFSPYVNISRVQLVTMAVRAARTMKPSALNDPPAGYTGSLPGFDSPDHTANLRLAEYSGLLAGLRDFGPDWNPWHDASRAEAAQVMWNVYRVAGGPRPALLSVDDFSSPASGWKDVLLANSSVGYYQGRYAITLLKPGVSTWSAKEIMLSDATIEIDASPPPGQGKTEYGIKFRLQGNGDCYQLTLGSDGSAGLGRVSGQARLELIPKQAFAAVKTEGTNHLTITFQGDRISAWVNNALLGSVTDATFPSGLFALHASSLDTGGVTVYFDNFRIWTPPPAS
ncbi:MAG: S-layer homology domain-containing protein, partial [Thermoleophilia bacterium]|nr:S-layer homology domain-containing protein [Thermoleophilia bacterium]